MQAAHRGFPLGGKAACILLSRMSVLLKPIAKPLFRLFAHFFSRPFLLLSFLLNV
jgi:hypothetical protein